MLSEGRSIGWRLHAAGLTTFQFIDVLLNSEPKPIAITCKFGAFRLNPRHVGQRVACAAVQFIAECSQPNTMGNRDDSSLETRVRPQVHLTRGCILMICVNSDAGYAHVLPVTPELR